MLTCPVCRDPLELDDGRTYRCPAGHAFDRAREGYVSLLPVGHGRSGISGDTAPMARARRRFLGRGHYAPLTRRVVERVIGWIGERAQGSRPAIAEAGCGTGHYIGSVAEALPDAAAFGFDVSREALRVAARDYPRVTFAVNDLNRRLCLPDASLHALLDIFAPRHAAEFARVLRPDGLLLVVIPGAHHMRELRDRLSLLDIDPDKRGRTVDQLAPAFEPAWEEALEWKAELEGEAVVDLVGMGPSAFHADDEAGSSTPPVGAARVTLSFVLLGFSPRPRSS